MEQCLLISDPRIANFTNFFFQKRKRKEARHNRDLDRISKNPDYEKWAFCVEVALSYGGALELGEKRKKKKSSKRVRVAVVHPAGGGGGGAAGGYSVRRISTGPELM